MSIENELATGEFDESEQQAFADGIATNAVAVRQAGAVGKALPPEDIKAQMTPAQAKVNAIADLTMSAYQRAATLKLTPDEIAALQAEFPDEAFKPGAAGKEHLIYIEHAFLRERFNQVVGLGQWSLIVRSRWTEPFTLPARDRKPAVDGVKVYVEAMLIVRGCFVGEAVGSMDYYPNNFQVDFSDAVEGAKTAAFRRCAKEFGVGLQAWKKDFGDGWWARRRGTPPKSPQNAPGPRPSPASAPEARPPSAVKPAPARPFPTAESRGKMINVLKAAPNQDNRGIVTEYFQKVGCLLPTEQLEDLELRFVPSMISEMRMLESRIYQFSVGERAEPAFEAHPEPVSPARAAAKKAATPIEVPREEKSAAPFTPPSQPATKPEWFMDVVVPIPRKGMKRADYLQDPDTIGSLYEARHGTDEESQESRQRLWGFVNHYEAKPWTGNGRERPPSKTDVEFREALNAFQEWFEQNHPGEKL